MTRSDVLKDFYLDDFGLECFAANLQSHIGEISRSLQLDQYRFSSSALISIPKGPHGTRPGSILSIRDRVSLWSAISLLAPKIDKTLLSGVLSYRLKSQFDPENLFEEMDEITIPFLKGTFISQTISPFTSWQYNWREFDEKSKEAYHKGYHFLAVTDIAAYFENINLDILKDQMVEVHPNEARLINFLIDSLCSWTVAAPNGHRPRRGIPQGSGISSFLGNIFLSPVDHKLSEYGELNDTIYLRYMDDIRVFCKNKVDASRSILLLESALRRLHLSVQTAKTKVLSQVDIRKLLFDDRIDQIIEVRARYRNFGNDRSLAIKRLQRIGRSTYAPENQAIDKRFIQRDGLFERATRMWMNSLLLYGSTAYIPNLNYTITRNADPRYSDIFIRSCRRFPDFTYDVTSIYSYLDSELNIYEFHECAILEAFRYMSRKSDKIFERCFSILEKDNSYNVKIAAIKYISKFKLTLLQLNKIHSIYKREKDMHCIATYITLLSQYNSVNFRKIIQELRKIPHHSSVDVVQFIKRICVNSSFTKGFLSYAFSSSAPFRLKDWIGVVWIASHTTDPKLKRLLQLLVSKRIAKENDRALRLSLQAIWERVK
ncbi:reverse transcriptase domain-containing protein [Phyllobacterium sp. 22552]|uniref:RNA-directed DNA polymerase n=1 Tax=Phyllobacterium sp. 22552 TaxID=3453941 RepID=UPI003F86BE6B